MMKEFGDGKVEYGMIGMMYGMGSMIFCKNNDREWWIEDKISEYINEVVGSCVFGKYGYVIGMFSDEFYEENIVCGCGGGIIKREKIGYDLVVRDMWVSWFERMSGLIMCYSLGNEIRYNWNRGCWVREEWKGGY